MLTITSHVSSCGALLCYGMVTCDGSSSLQRLDDLVSDSVQVSSSDLKARLRYLLKEEGKHLIPEDSRRR